MLILKDQLALKLVASREACTWLPQKIQTTSQNKLFKTPINRYAKQYNTNKFFISNRTL